MSRRRSTSDRAPTMTQTRDLISIPELCLVVLIGSSGSGKSTFAARHFKPSEVVNSDHYREVVSDDANDLTVSTEAFDAVHHIAGLRLGLGKLTVIDATSVKSQDRAPLVRIAREHDVFPIALVLDVDERICIQRNAVRPDRQFGPHVVRNHVRLLRQSLRGLEREGFRQVAILRSPEAIDTIRIERTPLWSNRKTETGPFDIIGDIHGCRDELEELLDQLGYQHDAEVGWRHPGGRKAVFLGDLVDRGPDVVHVVNLVRRMVEAGAAFCVPGNHDVKLQRALGGANVQISHGLADSLAQIEALPPEERAAWREGYTDFVDSLVSHLVLDGGRLVVAHAGMKAEYQGRTSGRVRSFALFGETTGETDEFGLPVRANWASDYRSAASVVYGHTPVPDAVWLNNTINIDTGCVFGGKLTALRWPERELVSVATRQTYAQPVRPLAKPASENDDTLLRIEDALGKQVITTRLMSNVIVEADRAAAALEVMSRFALDPRWLIYLPPTMSPSETASQPDYLEYPTEALAYYRSAGVARVVCEEKHMGSRAVLVVCRDPSVARKRFGVTGGEALGACYTRTGRRFFDDDALDRALLERVSAALGVAEFWKRFETDWVCMDAELLPWSAKAQGLLREQYAPVATAAQAALAAAIAATEATQARGIEIGAELAHLRAQRENAERYAAAYRAYCWETQGLEGVRIAPFHLLASKGKTYLDRPHTWHMEELARLAAVDLLFLATAYREVALDDPGACAAATDWWLELTSKGGEGMVVKPLDFVARGAKGLLQPAVKCRGREYLRIIYGPDYTEPEHLARLKKRGLGAKRALALREFALGVESLERFVAREPLWRTHQAVFGVLALESEPVDPRL